MPKTKVKVAVKPKPKAKSSPTKAGRPRLVGKPRFNPSNARYAIYNGVGKPEVALESEKPRNQMSTISDYSNNKEILVVAQDFLDYKAESGKPVLNYDFGAEQAIFAFQSGAPNAVPGVIPRKVEVYALPRASNANVSSTSYIVAYSTVGAPYANIGDGTRVTRAYAQRNTIINPTFNVNWKMVGMTNFDSLFDSSMVVPTGPSGTQFSLFRLSILDPDSGLPINADIQLRIVITYSAPLPVQGAIRRAVAYIDEFADDSDAGGVAPLSTDFAMIKMVSLQDRL